MRRFWLAVVLFVVMGPVLADEQTQTVVVTIPFLEIHTGPADVYPTGVVARIVQMSRFGDGTYRLVVEGLQRVRLHGLVQTDPHLAAEIELLEERGIETTAS